MSIWWIFYFLFVLVLGVVAYFTSEKIRREVYRPYFLKPVVTGFSIMGVVFLVSSFIFLIRM